MSGLTPNITKERLKAGKVAFGLGVRYSRSIDIAIAAAGAGYHYLFIDLEHSTMDIDACSQICGAAIGVGVTPLVRIPNQDYAFASRILDGGAQGLFVPHIETADEARMAVDGCFLPPLGSRSTMNSTILSQWRPIPAADYSKAVNDNILLSVALETAKGIDNVEEIAAVEGVDLITVGSNDLGNDMGIPGQFDHPDLLKAYDRVVAAARKHNKAVRLGGIYERRLINRSIELGSRAITLGADFGFMLQAMRAKLQEAAGDTAPELLE